MKDDSQVSQYPCGCSHITVKRFQDEISGKVFGEHWRCTDCGVEFVSLPTFFPPAPLTLMEEQATLRDQFAMAVLTGFLARGPKSDMTDQDISQVVYNMADAMLEGRK
jgi:hypothetical protein